MTKIFPYLIVTVGLLTAVYVYSYRQYRQLYTYNGTPKFMTMLPK